MFLLAACLNLINFAFLLLKCSTRLVPYNIQINLTNYQAMNM